MTTVGIALLAMLSAAVPAAAQSAENVAVVINENSPDSLRIGEYYAKARSLPAENVIRIRTSTDETVDRNVYVASIELPIGRALARERLQDKVLYIVLTKGVPLRIGGTVGSRGTMSSVDSELTLLYRKMVGQVIPPEGVVTNPYYLGDRELSEAKRFSHKDHDIFLVTRLDAYTTEQAIRLVDKAGMADADGKFVLDQRDALTNRQPEEWLALAASRLSAQGRRDEVVLETTTKAARDVSPVLGYFSWGSTDPQNRVRDYGMGFAPGALAGTWVATGARTFRAPPETWMPTAVGANRAGWFQGSPESLVGDLIREGATGVIGYVGEPSLNAIVRPQVLFPAYVAGFNLVESFYLATPHLGWQTIIVGDPLCNPVKREALARGEADPGFDPVSELPQYFGSRAFATIAKTTPGVPERAIALSMRGESLMGRGDLRAASAAFEEALSLAPRYLAPLLRAATLDEQAGRRDQAFDKYKRVLEIQPNNALALNNLAYAMAVHRGSPKEALPYAERAAAQAPDTSTVLDTLAWIHHLLGDDATATKVMARALKANPRDADIRLHAAHIYAGAGARAVADGELTAAIKLRPALAETDEVKQLRARIARLTVN